VFSYVVLEHRHNLFVAALEIRRARGPGGVFCGAVSQGEQFHDSFFIIDASLRGLPVLAPRKFFSWSKKEKKRDGLFPAGSVCFPMAKGRDLPDMAQC
jgi:hypothetical protein